MAKHRYDSQVDSLQDIDFNCINVESVRGNEVLFFILCASSYVESGSHLYANNLIHFFDGNSILQDWLTEHWEPEELEHGRILTHSFKNTSKDP